MNIEKIVSAVGQTIADRGWNYFKKGKVMSLVQSKSTWLATVAGTEPYHVRLTLTKTGSLQRADCDCPYEFYCKHIAAVWFAVLSQSEPQIETDNVLITDTYFSPIDEHSHLQELRSVFNHYSKGCDYWQTRRFAGELEPFLDFNRLSNEAQFQILKTFYGRLCTALQRSDDSDGLLGSLLDEAAFQLNQLYHQSDEPKLRTQIERAWLKWINDKENFWLVELTGMWTHWQKALNQSNRAAKVLEWIAEYEKTAESYEHDKIAEWRYQSLQYVDETQAADFLQAHLHIPALRNIAIEALMSTQDYKQAEKLLLASMKDKCGYLYRKEWQEKLLLIAEKTEQTDKVIQYAEHLILVENSTLNPDHYEALKSACTPEQWQIEIEKIETFLLQNGFENKLAQFYILEKSYESLKALLLDSRTLSFVARYAAKVPKAEREAVIFYWLSLLEQSMKDLTARPKYAQWVRSANSLLKKYPYIRDELVKVVTRFQEKYKMRKALLEELNHLNI